VFHLNGLDFIRLIFASFNQVIAINQHADQAADGILSLPGD
jgi:hypothetical protein